MPEEYGGSGVDKLYSVVQMEELARGGCTGIGFSLHSEIVAPTSCTTAPRSRRSSYLPRLASGEMVGAIAMSEPAAGSDLQGIKSTAISSRRQLPAQRQQDLHHQRLACRPGGGGCQDRPDAGAKGTSLLLVERGMKGFETGKRLKKLGLKAQDTSELFFDNVRVPARTCWAARHSRTGLHLPDGAAALGAHADRRDAVASAQAAIDWTVHSEGAQGVRPAGRQLPEHPLHPGRTADRSADRAGVRRQVH
jgi:acyl-CoA dehydrogenase